MHTQRGFQKECRMYLQYTLLRLAGTSTVFKPGKVSTQGDINPKGQKNPVFMQSTGFV